MVVAGKREGVEKVAACMVLADTRATARRLGISELTVQDQPLNINMESLLWQEDLKGDAVILGSQPGFDTNRQEVGA